MSLLVNSTTKTLSPSFLKPSLNPSHNSTSPCMLRLTNHKNTKTNKLRVCFFNPTNDPLIQDALKEPVAFMGGVFAGLLRLDLNEEPLREWVTRTVESSGISEEEVYSGESKSEEEAPEQIEIE